MDNYDAIIENIFSDQPSYEKVMLETFEYRNDKDIKDIRMALNKFTSKGKLKKDLNKILKIIK